jgi:hypothetical protein
LASQRSKIGVLRRNGPLVFAGQFDDFEWRELLHAGRAGYRLGGTAVNLGLQAVTKIPSQPVASLLSVEPEETVEQEGSCLNYRSAARVKI